MKKAKKKVYDDVPFKQQKVNFCCGAKVLYGFGDDEQANDIYSPFPKKKDGFVARVENAADYGSRGKVLMAITNHDEQTIAEMGLKAAGFRVMRREINPGTGNTLTFWIRPWHDSSLG